MLLISGFSARSVIFSLVFHSLSVDVQTLGWWTEAVLLPHAIFVELK